LKSQAWNHKTFRHFKSLIWSLHCKAQEWL
jgi:hypothetical protein